MFFGSYTCYGLKIIEVTLTCESAVIEVSLLSRSQAVKTYSAVWNIDGVGA
jgi:hypothetical protein